MATIKKFLGFSLGPILGALFSFITVPICTFFLLPNEYGKTSMFNLFYSIALMGILFGFDQSYIREFNEEKNTSKLITNTMLVPVMITAIVVFLMFLYAKDFSNFIFGEEYYVDMVYCTAILLPLLLIERFILIKIRMEEKSFEYSFYSLLISFLSFVLTLFYIFILKKNDFSAVVYSTIISHYILDIFLLCKYSKEVRIKIKEIDISLLWKVSKYALPLAICTIIGQIFNGMDKFFLRFFSTYDELGFYQTALSIVNVIALLQSIFATFWIPIAYRWKANNVDEKEFELVQNIVILFCILLYGTIFLCIPIVERFIGANYGKSFEFLPYLAIGPLVTMVTSTTVLGIDFSRKTSILLILNVFTIIINGILNYIFMLFFGSIGVAMATAVSNVVLFAIKTIYSRKLWFNFKLINICCFLLFISLMAMSYYFFGLSQVTHFIVFAIMIISLILNRKMLFSLRTELERKLRN